jgi:hypothetical protein
MDSKMAERSGFPGPAGFDVATLQRLVEVQGAM